MENIENINENKIEANLDNKQRIYSTGKRKNSIARVWIKRGSGSISINGKSLEKYFASPVLQMIVNQPLEVVQSDNSYEIMATVKGGGLSGQAGGSAGGLRHSKHVIMDPTMTAQMPIAQQIPEQTLN